MATDSNLFDTCLKKNLVRDLVFRMTVWSIISGLAAHFALVELQGDPFEYLKRMGVSVGKLVNYLGSIAILLSVPALFLKDLEQSNAGSQVKEFSRGYAAGLIRRLAGDLTLWTLGAIVTMISSLLIVLIKIQYMLTSEDFYPIVEILVILFLLLAVVSALNVWVRRAGGTFVTRHTKIPWVVFTLYGTFAVLTGTGIKIYFF